MNKVDVLYKNYNIQPSGFKDLLKNCDLSLFTTDEKFSKLLTKASITKYAIKQQRKSHSSAAELISNVFKKHPRNFANDDLVSSDSRESITNDHILRTKFQRHKKSFEQIRKLLPKEGSDENLWENFTLSNNIDNMKIKKHLSNDENINNLVENVEDGEKITKLKRSRENVYENKKIKAQVSNESLASIEKVTKVKKSREQIDENVQTVQTEMNNNCSTATDDILGVNLSSILLKICSWLGELSHVIHEGILPIDGAEDYVARETRCKEFATRFSRQYDYEFSRLLGTLRTLIPRITNRLSVNRVAQNITKSCQIMLQAIMQYCSHIPTTLSSIEKKQFNVHVKFHQMLKNILEFFVLVKKIGKSFMDVRNSLETVEEVDKNCGALMILIEEKFLKPPPPIPKAQPTKVVKKIVPKDTKKSPYQNSSQSKSIEKRLSMYSMSFKNRAGKTLGPKRINVQSRYKTAGIVKPPVSDTTDQEKKDSEKKKLLAQKRSSQILCDGSNSTLDPPRINEDEIETMVEKVAKCSKNNLQLQTNNNHELRNKVETLLQSWTEISNEKKEDATNNKEMIVTQMLNLFEQLQDESQKQVSQKLLLGKSNSEHDELAKSQVSVTGPKNAKLIFIKDKSLYGCLSNTAVPEKSSQELVKFKTPSTKKNKHAITLATMPIILPQPQPQDADNNKVTISPINKKSLTKAKEKSFINILKYRKDYQIFTSHNHMYRKGRVQPWHITNKIAERLLSNLLFSVLSEINLNEIVEQIYKAEFE